MATPIPNLFQVLGKRFVDQAPSVSEYKAYPYNVSSTDFVSQGFKFNDVVESKMLFRSKFHNNHKFNDFKSPNMDLTVDQFYKFAKESELELIEAAKKDFSSDGIFFLAIKHVKKEIKILDCKIEGDITYFNINGLMIKAIDSSGFICAHVQNSYDKLACISLANMTMCDGIEDVETAIDVLEQNIFMLLKHCREQEFFGRFAPITIKYEYLVEPTVVCADDHDDLEQKMSGSIGYAEDYYQGLIKLGFTRIEAEYHTRNEFFIDHDGEQIFSELSF